MSRGVLLFCFNTDTCKYHRIAERCVELIKKNLKLEVTVVTNFETFKQFKHLGMVNFKLFDNEIGNKRLKEDWHNLDRCHAYDLSPYDTTLLMDIDYLPFTNNLLEYFDVEEDFLIHDKIHDLTNKNVYDFRKNSKHNLIEYSDEISTNENYTINDYDLEIRAEELNNMILKLPKATKLVFNLFAIDGYSHKEIAEQLNISTNTSKWHVKEARKKLKEQILKKQNLVEK